MQGTIDLSDGRFRDRLSLKWSCYNELLKFVIRDGRRSQRKLIEDDLYLGRQRMLKRISHHNLLLLDTEFLAQRLNQVRNLLVCFGIRTNEESVPGAVQIHASLRKQWGESQLQGGCSHAADSIGF